MNLVDTSGWIEFFFQGPNASFFSPPIENTEELLVPVVCLYEVFKKVCLAGDKAKAKQAVAQMKEGLVVDINEEIALKAAMVSLKHKLPMADSLIYATARVENAEVWTQDKDFESLPGVFYMEAKKKT